MCSFLCIVCMFTGCNKKFADADLDVKQIQVSSTSITKEGKLLTATAANKKTNNPPGLNASPQVSWEEVEGADYYVVCMFDEDANWLHWFKDDINSDITSLEQGEVTEHTYYVGPYPPKSAGRHQYRIEVFAIKQRPNGVIGKLNKTNSYKAIVEHLNQVGNNSDNIIARGYVTGSYQYGDDTIDL